MNKKVECDGCVALLKTIAESMSGEEYCPFCNKDIRKQYDCNTCNNDHLSRKCQRDGGHDKDCIVIKAQKYLRFLISP